MTPTRALDKVSLSTKPHLQPNFDPLLHQWRLLPWEENSSTGGGPFHGIFSTLAARSTGSTEGNGEVPQLPLSVRAAFRPVLVASPNLPILVEAMLLTSGFVGARSLVRGLVQGLRELVERTPGDPQEVETWDSRPTTSKAAEMTPIRGKIAAPNRTLHLTTILHGVARCAVRVAADLLSPETAKEFRAARRKLGLASLTTSERKAKTDGIARAVEVRVAIAGFVRALLGVEGGEDMSETLDNKKKTENAAPTAATVGALAGGGGGIKVLGSKAGTTGMEAGTEETEVRRAAMVATFERTEIFGEILKPLVELEVGNNNGGLGWITGGLFAVFGATSTLTAPHSANHNNALIAHEAKARSTESTVCTLPGE